MLNFFKSNLLVLVVVNMGNIVNYLFQLIVGRSLSLDDFGTLNALGSLFIILSVPATVLPMVFARYTVLLEKESDGHVKELMLKGFYYLGGAALILITIGVFCVEYLQVFFHVEKAGPFYIFLMQFFISFVLPPFWGGLQGLKRFGYFSYGSSLSTVVRLLLGMLLVLYLGYGLEGALLAGVLALVFEFAVALVGLRDILKTKAHALPAGLAKQAGHFTYPVFISSLMTLLLTNMDLVLARHFFPGDESGHYATAAIIARIALFGPNVLVVVMFPEVSRKMDEGEGAGRIFLMSLGMASAMAFGFAALCSLFPSQVLQLLFGQTEGPSSDLLPIVVFSMACLCASNITFNFLLARFEYWFLWFQVSGCVGFFLYVFKYHETAKELAWASLGATGLTFVCVLVGICIRSFHGKRRVNA